MGVSTAHKTSAETLYTTNNNCVTNNNNNILKMPVPTDMTSKNVGEFYRDAKIFITGGTGFVGKALIEKLLRSCDLIDTIYILLRSKRGMNTDQRLHELLKNPVFNRIKEKDPDLFNKVKIVEGDVSLPSLGLSDTDRNKLCDNVDIVFHSAASVRFNESLKDSVTLNTLGTLRIVELCTKIKKLKSFVHVSTAYSNADKKEVEEMVYKPPYDPYTIMNCIENLPDDALNLLQEKLLGKHPNTYTFTKALAEHIIWEYSAQLPCCIVRPSIVTGAWKEPFPGWVDNISGVTGIIMEVGRGTIKSIICQDDLTIDIIPVDIVVNTLVTAAWHTVANRSNTIRVYNCTSGNINSINWKDFGVYIQKGSLMYPTKYMSWYPGFTFRTNRVVHWVCSLLFQTVPSCIFDFILLCTKHKPMMFAISQKFKKACKAGEFCSLNEWDFKTSTMSCLLKDLKSAEDGENYNIDIGKDNGFTWDAYVQAFVLGIRKYVLKDDLTSLPMAKTKLNRFYWANKFLQVLTMYLLLKVTVL